MYHGCALEAKHSLSCTTLVDGSIVNFLAGLNTMVLSHVYTINQLPKEKNSTLAFSMSMSILLIGYPKGKMFTAIYIGIFGAGWVYGTLGHPLM